MEARPCPQLRFGAGAAAGSARFREILLEGACVVADVGKCLRRRDGRMDSWVIDSSRRGPSLRFPFIFRGAVAPGGRFEPISTRNSTDLGERGPLGPLGRRGGRAVGEKRPTHSPPSESIVWTSYSASR